MNHRTIVMCIALFVVIVAGMFAFAYMKKQELNTATLKTDDTAVPKVAYADLTRITAKHFFIDGVHTFVGEIPFPTPCDLLESSATIAESFPEQITLDFTVVNNSDMCAQVETVQRFKVEAQASAKATVQARFMGRPVELNLVPPAEGETPGDFELFIKG